MGKIMRSWTGTILAVDCEAYREYIAQTGLPEYRATAGNIDAWMLCRDIEDDRTEVITLSLWENRAAIEAFAGKDIEQAVFYPDDDRFLITRDLTVRHYEVFS